MKYFKVTIRQPGGASTPYSYPSNYQYDIGNYAVDHLYYDDADGPALLLVIPDADAHAGIIRQDVEEITEAEIKALSESNETRHEEILDEAKLRRIELKVAMGLSLTTEESNASVIGHKDAVFAIGKILADRIDDWKEKELAKPQL